MACWPACCAARWWRKRGKSLGQQLQELFAEVGSFYSLRENFHLTPEVKEKFTGKLRGEPRDLMGRKITEVVRTDGLKLLFADGSWVCYRLVGNRTGGPGLFRSPQQGRSGETERSRQTMDLRIEQYQKSGSCHGPSAG